MKCCTSLHRLVAAFGLLFVATSHAFVPFSRVSEQRTPSSAHLSTFLHASSSSNNQDNSASFSMESLRARQEALKDQESSLTESWKSASCASSIPVALSDTWIRRLDVDYPWVACGSASNEIYVAHLETGHVVAQSTRSVAMNEDETTNDDDELPELQETLRLLYGSYDGGGTLAIALREGLICAAPRSGSVQVYRWDGTSKVLLNQGKMAALQNTLVTCVALDEDSLWVGTADGRLLAFPIEDDLPLTMQSAPCLEWKFSSTITSLSLHSELGYALVTTKKGSVELVQTEDDDRVVVAWYPPLDAGNVRSSSGPVVPLSTTLVPHSEGGYSIACGASDGSLFVHPLSWNVDLDCLDEHRPLKNGMAEGKPRHGGPLKCLVSPGPDLLVSGGQDGTVRLWELGRTTQDVSCLYQFLGYKVWLGSLWTDGARLVSDGADNTVVVHDFSADEDGNDDIQKERRGWGSDS